MNKYLIIIAGLSIICIWLFIYICTLKKQIRKIKEELVLTKDTSYNRQITVSLIDKDMSDMTAQINDNLDFQKELKWEAEESKKQMKQSISDIAHDLRTPLTVIKGNLQMLERDGSLSGRGRDYLNICLDKTDTLKSMVDDFFELSVLESENINARLEPVDVTNKLVQFVLEQEAVIRNYKLTPEIILPDKNIFIMADEQMLTRMFSNLFNNVIKYAKDSFSLSLIRNLDDESCKIVFENRIDEQKPFDVEHLFDRTYRGDKSRHGQGAGLGLYIVKLLAHKQKAEVYASLTDNRLQITLAFKCYIC